MAANVSLLQLRTRARRRADLRGLQTNLADSEVNDIINEQLSEFWDLLVLAAPPAYYNEEATIAITGATSYPLPADFLSLQRVWVDCGNGVRRPLRAVDGMRRARVVPAVSSANVILEYTYTAPTLLNDDDTIDGVNGWDALIVRLAAKQMLSMSEEDVSDLNGEIAALEGRIRTSARRSRTGARQLPDVRDYWGGWNWDPSVVLCGFQIKGPNIEIYQQAYPVPYSYI